MPEPRYLAVGRIVRPHGIRGELRVHVLTGYPERLGQHTCFYVTPPGHPEAAQRYPVENMRWHRRTLLLKLGGCDDRNAAERLRDMLVQIPIEEAVPLEEGEYYHFQLIGVQVETEDGEQLGQVAEVLETDAHDVYAVRGRRGEMLLPAVDDVVLELDLDRRQMVVRLLPGMSEE